MTPAEYDSTQRARSQRVWYWVMRGVEWFFISVLALVTILMNLPGGQ